MSTTTEFNTPKTEAKVKTVKVETPKAAPAPKL